MNLSNNVKIAIPLAITLVSYVVYISVDYQKNKSSLSDISRRVDLLELQVQNMNDALVSLDKQVAILSDKQDKVLDYLIDIRQKMK